MSVQFAGSRSIDERRRRRLAVSGEGTGSDTADLATGEEKPLPDCVPAELCAASPWIPRSAWKLWTLAAILIAGVTAVAGMGFYRPTFRPELAPALDPLFQGDEPRLIVYLETVFWTLSGQLALLVGWHRAHSRLDFRGRYRIWPWAAAAMFLCGFCVVTNLHAGLGAVVYDLKLFDLSGPRVGWLAPAVCLLLPFWLLIDRDLRRSVGSLVLLRTSLACLLSGVVVAWSGSSWFGKPVSSAVELLCGLYGSAFLMLSLWVQGWYVAYVTPDPPTPTPFRFPRLRFGLLSWLWNLLSTVFRRKPAPPPPKRRKKSEETGTGKRKRKTRRATKPRTKKVVEEDAEDDSLGEEDAAEAEAGEDDAEVENDASEAYDEEAYDEEELEALTAPAVKNPAPPPKNGPSQNQSRPQDNRASSGSGWSSAAQQSSDDEEDDDDDDDGRMYRVDGPSPDMLKGLSKRQRRELKRQWREQQRAQGRR